MRYLSKLEEGFDNIFYGLLAPIMRTRGIETCKTKGKADRVALYTRKLIEMGPDNIAEINAITDEPDVIVESVALARLFMNAERIKITRTPLGPGIPEWVRAEWPKAGEMDGIKLSASSVPERSLVTSEELARRDTYVVLASEAVGALEKKSPKAGKWFRQNVSDDKTTYSFGADEVEVITKQG